MRERNKTVLLQHGREQVGQLIEREFERISALVTREPGRLTPPCKRKLLGALDLLEDHFAHLVAFRP